ncbi:MAG: class II fumarate hydratase [Salinisphaera sp.]|jgi:fumarate hydratase class II|nr:class II fumarate hydratase [Salinisphaera sp.]
MSAGNKTFTVSWDLPIGIDASGKRAESDSMGSIEVPADRYWGAQTQRSLIHFSIGEDRMPKAVYHAYGTVKKAAAMLHKRAGRMDRRIADAIMHACEETIAGDLDDSYPLFVYQTGSGTQSNMNVNEVISNRAIQLLGGELGSKTPVHPNDHVNMGQSSNDTFPTAMHIAMVAALEDRLFPAVRQLADTIEGKAGGWIDRPKIGRTHLQDAVPLTVGQEWSGFGAQLRMALASIEHARDGLYALAVGGTAVGTGLNAPAGFSQAMADMIAELTGQPFTTAPNKFAAQGGLDATVAVMAALRGLAVVLMKIANDLRWLASGPRCGIGELKLPATEPGSSIMPGKVNPTQCEALVMICIQVIGLDNAVAFGGSQGNFELNAMRPSLINNVLQANRILADGCDMFCRYTVAGAELDDDTIDEHLERSLMLVTALSPEIGYDKAAEIAHKASEDGGTLKEATLALGYLDEDVFDRIADPAAMTGSGLAGA